MIKVLIADDHPFVLSGICHELESEPDMEVIGRAQNSGEMADILDATACDVIVTDYSMPGGRLGDGLMMLKALQRLYPATQVVVITMLKNPALIRDMQKAGVAVILNKIDPTSHIRPAVRAAYYRRAYLPPSVQALLTALEPANPRREVKLSKRELDVLRQCAAGVPLVEIARRANRSDKTISAQKSVAMRKLGLSNDYELYQYAETHGLLCDSPQSDVSSLAADTDGSDNKPD